MHAIVFPFNSEAVIICAGNSPYTLSVRSTTARAIRRALSTRRSPRFLSGRLAATQNGEWDSGRSKAIFETKSLPVLGSQRHTEGRGALARRVSRDKAERMPNGQRLFLAQSYGIHAACR